MKSRKQVVYELETKKNLYNLYWPLFLRKRVFNLLKNTNDCSNIKVVIKNTLFSNTNYKQKNSIIS